MQYSTCSSLSAYLISSRLVLQLRDIVLGHVVPQKLTFEDLKVLPPDNLTPTLLTGNSLQLSTAGATSGSNAGQPGSGSISLVEVDLNACAPNSTIHTVRALLPIANLELPSTAAPRNVTVSRF
jgi:hypothetical protein